MTEPRFNAAGIRSCPFCGALDCHVDTDERCTSDPGLVVHCGCGAEGTTCLTPDRAIEEWNKRVGD